jgi:ABC-type transporter Mla subunit MlaD
VKNRPTDTVADQTDSNEKVSERSITVSELETALDAIWRELAAEPDLSRQFRDEGEAIAAFAAAATELLNAVDDAVFTLRHRREETRALLDRLDSRLASSHG